MTRKENILKGIWKENPIFVTLLGLCSTMAVTYTVQNAIGLAIGFIFVMILSNVIIAAIRKIVPNEIRIPIYIVVVATLVALVEMLMKAYLPNLYNAIGFWISLIVVNCIILGRAEAFASQNTVFDSLLDAIGMSVGYAGVLLLMAFTRELLGTGGFVIWDGVSVNILSGNFFNAQFFQDKPAAFILLGIFIGLANLINNRRKEVKK